MYTTRNILLLLQVETTNNEQLRKLNEQIKTFKQKVYELTSYLRLSNAESIMEICVKL